MGKALELAYRIPRIAPAQGSPHQASEPPDDPVSCRYSNGIARAQPGTELGRSA